MQSLGPFIMSVTTGACMGGLSGMIVAPGFGLLAGGFTGGILGFLVSPVVIYCLQCKVQPVANGVVFAATLVVTVVATLTRLPLDILLLSSGAMIAMCFVVLAFVPTVSRYPRGCCISCGYDLTGNQSGRCPECGKPSTDRAAHWSRERRRGLAVATLAVMLSLGGVAATKAARIRKSAATRMPTWKQKSSPSERSEESVGSVRSQTDDG
jgi:hypothetical protein